METFAKERDLSLEALRHEIAVLKKKLELAEQDPRNLVERVMSHLNGFIMRRRLKTYFS
jgi:hypothetical protein